ncbi:MAG: putative toxin-antitoxin system toxin component, PIN family [Gemmatimonadetes bacterium]|nr:putative toxin-antitoxin system toxin component, PIN family [Gemmatimonadota bacterium]
MRVFLDTNVLISAFATRGLCADLMRHLLTEHEVLTGEVNLAELRRVLLHRFGVPAAQADAVEELLRDQVVVPAPPTLLPLAVRDPDDAWVLASAVAGGADLLVTGDQDLLVVAPDAPIPIVTPREAWGRLRGNGGAAPPTPG